jgi:hypothetical protein
MPPPGAARLPFRRFPGGIGRYACNFREIVVRLVGCRHPAEIQRPPNRRGSSPVFHPFACTADVIVPFTLT